MPSPLPCRLSLAFALFAACLLRAQPNHAWELVFEDHFDGKMPDTSLWHTAAPWARTYLGPDAAGYDYAVPAGAIRVDSGRAYLLTKRLDQPVWRRVVDQPYVICSSPALFQQLDETARNRCRCGQTDLAPHRPGLVDSLLLEDGRPNLRPFGFESATLYSRQSFRYGRFEARLRFTGMPRYSRRARGQWPAFWLFNWGNEIDIFELNNYYRWPEPKHNYRINLHLFLDADGNPATPNEDFSAEHLRRRNLDLRDFEPDSAGFYTVGAIWVPPGYYDREETVLWYINGTVAGALRFSDLRAGGRSGSIAGRPFPLHLILNAGLAAWQDRDGKPYNVWSRYPNARTEFPFGMEVDYVKVWKMADYSRDAIDSTLTGIWVSPEVRYPAFAEVNDRFVAGSRVRIGSGKAPHPWDDQFHVLRAVYHPVPDSPQYFLPVVPVNYLDIRASDRIVLRPNFFKVDRGARFSARIGGRAETAGLPDLLPTAGRMHYKAWFSTNGDHWLRIRLPAGNAFDVRVYRATSRGRVRGEPVYRSSSQPLLPGRIARVWNGEGLREEGGYYRVVVGMGAGGGRREWAYLVRASHAADGADLPFGSALLEIPSTAELY